MHPAAALAQEHCPFVELELDRGSGSQTELLSDDGREGDLALGGNGALAYRVDSERRHG